MKTYSPVMDEYFRIALETGLIKEATPQPGNLYPDSSNINDAQKGEAEKATSMPQYKVTGKVPSEDMLTRSDRSRAIDYKPTNKDSESRRPGLKEYNQDDADAQLVVWFLCKKMGLNLKAETFVDGVWGEHSREALNKLIREGEINWPIGQKLNKVSVNQIYNKYKSEIHEALAQTGADAALAKLNIPAGKALAADDSSTLAVPSSVVGQETIGKFTKEQINAFMGIYNDPRFKGKDFPFVMEEATKQFPNLFPKSKYQVMDFTETKNLSQNAEGVDYFSDGSVIEDQPMPFTPIANSVKQHSPGVGYDYDSKSGTWKSKANGSYWKWDESKKAFVPADGPGVKKHNYSSPKIRELQNALTDFWAKKAKLSFEQKGPNDPTHKSMAANYVKADSTWGPKTFTSLYYAANVMKNNSLIVGISAKTPPSPEKIDEIILALKTTLMQGVSDGEMNEKMKENMWQGATLSEASMNKTSNHVVNELISLANDLDKMGEVKAAIAVDNQLSLYKIAMDKLYDITGETGEQLLNSAHPEGSVTLAPAQNDGGVVETAVDQQKKNIAVVSKDPTGKYASTIKSLIATANRLESEGNISDAEKVDRAINELIKKNPFLHNGVAKAASTSINKKYAAVDKEILVSGLKRIRTNLQGFLGKIDYASGDAGPTLKEHLNATISVIDNCINKSFSGRQTYGVLKQKFDLLKSNTDFDGGDYYSVTSYVERFVPGAQVVMPFTGTTFYEKALGVNDARLFGNFMKNFDRFLNEINSAGGEGDSAQSSATIEGQGQTTQTQGVSGTEVDYLYQAYATGIKNAIYNLKSVKEIIISNKDKVIKLMNLGENGDVIVAKYLQDTDAQIKGLTTQLSTKNMVNENTYREANKISSHVYPILQKLQKKFGGGRIANSKFSISKRAGFLEELDGKLDPTTPAKPSAGGHGGGGKGGSGQYNKNVDGALATQIQTLLNEIREMRKEPAQIKVDGRFGPKTNRELYDVTQAFLTQYSDIGTTPTISYEQATNELLQPVVQTLNNIKTKISSGAQVNVPGATPGAPGQPGAPGGGAGGKGKATVDRRSDFLIKMERLDNELKIYQNRISYPARFNHFGEYLKRAAMAKDLIERENLKTSLRSILESPVGKELAQEDITHYEGILNSYDEALNARAYDNFKTDMSGVRTLYYSDNPDTMKARESLEVPIKSKQEDVVDTTQAQQPLVQPDAQGQVVREPVQTAQPEVKGPNKKQQDFSTANATLAAIKAEMKKLTPKASYVFNSESIKNYINDKGMTKGTFEKQMDKIFTDIHSGLPAGDPREKENAKIEAYIKKEMSKI